ncbi:MAG: hypothetical protein DRI34_01195 [Deltaproteobacteria bacterium]|nr:MAG: hypothetical protein DRI34_01195 [Deltaproteobacteria bacterium]
MKLKLQAVAAEGTRLGLLAEVDLDREQLLVGRAAEADLQLPDASVSARHFLVERCQEGWEITDLGSRLGTRLNGTRLVAHQAVPLRIGDRVRAGAFLLTCAAAAADPARLLAEADAAEDRHPVPARLLLLNGPRAGSSLELGPAGSLLLGRGADCDIVLDDSCVSRRHARIEFRRGRAWLRDLDSANGCLVNARRSELRRLEHGDELLIGRLRLRYLQPEACRGRWLDMLRNGCRRVPAGGLWPAACALVGLGSMLVLLVL